VYYCCSYAGTNTVLF
nr:immunoglobulin light chain junction region [Macaca mulatta]